MFKQFGVENSGGSNIEYIDIDWLYVLLLLKQKQMFFI